MAVEVTTLELNARLTNAEQTIAQLQRMGQAGKQTETSFGDLALKIAGYTTAANMVVQAGQKTIQVLKDQAVQAVVLAASYEKARMTWGVLVGDMQKGTAVFDKIFAFSAKSPLTFESANQAAITIKGFGVAAQDLIPTLSKLGDLAMGDSAKMSSLALVYGQVFAQGKAKAQDLYQFINAGVPIFDMLAKSMGKSAGQVKELTANGAVTFEEIARAINYATSEGGAFYGMSEKLSQSISGKLSTATDLWRSQLALIGTDTIPLISTALDAVIDRLGKANRGAQFISANRQFESSQPNMGLILTGYEFARKNNPGSETKGPWLKGDSLQQIKDYFDSINKLQDLYEAVISDKTSSQSDIANAQTWIQNIMHWRDQYKHIFSAAGLHRDAGGGGGSAPLSDYSLMPYGGIESDPLLKNIIAYNSQKYGPEPNGYNFGDPSTPYTTNSYGMQAGPSGPSYMTGGPLTSAIIDPNKIDASAVAMENLRKSLADVATSSMVSAFDSIGKALAEGANGAQSMAQSMQSIASQAASQSGALMMNAGLTAMMAGQLEIGIPLFLAGGGLEILGGYFGSSSSSNSTSAGASAADLAALTAYYQKTEAFNAQGRNRVLGYASGTNYAMGGWSWVGERGPELMRVPTGAQIIPNHRIPGYAGGLNTPSLGNMTVNILPPSGYEAVQSETNGPDGRAVEIAFRRIVRDEMGRASAQQAARSGRRVTT